MRGRGKHYEGSLEEWRAILQPVENEDVRSFFLREVERGQRRVLHLKKLRYGGERSSPWRIIARKRYANVYQEKRFDGDLALWHELFPRSGAKSTRNERQLTFRLHTLAELELFRRTLEKRGDDFVFAATKTGAKTISPKDSAKKT